MKLQQVLDYLELEELPKAGVSTSQKKMACLVERVTGVRDYAIAKNGGIVADIGFQSQIKRIVEFYPEPTKKEKAKVPEVPIVPLKAKVEESVNKSAEVLGLYQAQKTETLAAFDEMIGKSEFEEDNPESAEEIQRATDLADLEEILPPDPEAEPTGEKPVSTREQMITFLEANRNKRTTLELKADDQLAEMCKRFGKEF